MKKTFLYVLVLMGLSLSCKKEKITYKYKIYSETTYQVGYTPSPIANADVYLYATEMDYLLDTNVVKQGKTNAQGLFEFLSENRVVYWTRVKKDTLNNLRNGRIQTDAIYQASKEVTEIPFHAALSTTPVKLQLNLRKNGTPVTRVHVQLYYSLEDYNKDILPMDRPGSPNEMERTYNAKYNSVVNEIADANGTVIFNDLEPRQYWFKVTDFSNNLLSTTEISTESPLLDDPNVTTVRDIGIY